MPGCGVRGDRSERSVAEVTQREKGNESGSHQSLPDIEAMRRWLLSDAIASREGAILSWSNPHHAGYPYPEAGGLFLSTVCTALSAERGGSAVADRAALWLCESIAADGGVGRDGLAYLFDSAIALTGLLRYRAVGGRAGGDEPIHRLRRFIGEQIAAGTAVRPMSAAIDGRWSTQFGAHLVKCLHSLHLYARAFGEHVQDDLVATLINRSGHQPSPVYVHPFCYEQEGHVVVAHYGLSSLFEPVEGALDWLAELQQPNGGILAFANGMDGFGEARSDATAQAVRLWLLGDRARYAKPIALALTFLAGCQAPQGGIRYAPDSDDTCSWSTMFTLQAVQWFVDGPRLDELL